MRGTRAFPSAEGAGPLPPRCLRGRWARGLCLGDDSVASACYLGLRDQAVDMIHLQASACDPQRQPPKLALRTLTPEAGTGQEGCVRQARGHQPRHGCLWIWRRQSLVCAPSGSERTVPAGFVSVKRGLWRHPGPRGEPRKAGGAHPTRAAWGFARVRWTKGWLFWVQGSSPKILLMAEVIRMRPGARGFFLASDRFTRFPRFLNHQREAAERQTVCACTCACVRECVHVCVHVYMCTRVCI